MNSMTGNFKSTAPDPIELRNIFGEFATGVTIVTTVGDNGAPVGMAVNSFSSVSLEPALILWSIGLKTPSLGAFRSHPSFAINILCESSKELALNFARPSDNKFAGIDYKEGINGVPVLTDAAAVIECDTKERLPGGDHEIYIGQVRNITSNNKAPLLFHKGKFAKLGDLL